MLCKAFGAQSEARSGLSVETHAQPNDSSRSENAMMKTAKPTPRKRKPKARVDDPAQSTLDLAKFGKLFERALERLYPNAIASTKRRR